MKPCAMGVLALATIVCTSTLLAQAPQGAAQPGPAAPRMQMPPRDGAGAQTPTGTGRISGRVVASDNGNPLRRAQVHVSAPELRINRAASTDAEGRYEVANLPQGRYSIAVSRNGYVSLQFGQQRPFEPGRPLDLGDGQLMERIDFALPRGSVITGRVTDELGEPLVGVHMQAMRYQYLPSGQRQLVGAGTGNPFAMITNDLGEFRVFGLMPGTYILSALPDQGGVATVTTVGPGVAMFARAGGGAATGIAASPTIDSDGYATTYYPGTLSAEEAQPITVGIAEEVSASFALSAARMTRISGVVRNSQGQPLAGTGIGLRSRTGVGMFARSLQSTGQDGTFTIVNVPPGEHVIEVIPFPGPGMNLGARLELEETASVPVTAGGDDITDLIITTSVGATVTGRVVFEGNSSDSRPGRIFAASPDAGMAMPIRIGPDNGVIDATGRFSLRGVSGRVLFRTTPMAPGPISTWTIKSVAFNGVDITDTPLDVAMQDDVNGIEIVLTDQQTTLSGAVRNARGEPTKDYVVAIFPDNLKEGALPTRFTRTVRPDQEGRYQVRGLPAGSYFAAAVEALEQGGEWDPAFRKQVEPMAKRFRLTEGQALSIDLPLLQ